MYPLRLFDPHVNGQPSTAKLSFTPIFHPSRTRPIGTVKRFKLPRCTKALKGSKGSRFILSGMGFNRPISFKCYFYSQMSDYRNNHFALFNLIHNHFQFNYLFSSKNMKKITKNRPIWKAYIRLAVVLAVAWLSGGAQVFWELLCKVQQQHKLHYYKTKTGSSYKFPFRSAYFFKIKKGKESLPTFPFQMSQFPLAHFAQWMRETSDEIRFAWSNSLNNRKRIKEAFSQAYFSVPHADLLLTAMGTLSIAWFVRRSLHRYKNANDLPLSFFEGRQKKLKGLAVSVNDSDNIRFYHQPHFYSLFKPNLSRQGTQVNHIIVNEQCIL